MASATKTAAKRELFFADAVRSIETVHLDGDAMVFASTIKLGEVVHYRPGNETEQADCVCADCERMRDAVEEARLEADKKYRADLRESQQARADALWAAEHKERCHA